MDSGGDRSFGKLGNKGKRRVDLVLGPSAKVTSYGIFFCSKAQRLNGNVILCVSQELLSSFFLIPPIIFPQTPGKAR